MDKGQAEDVVEVGGRTTESRSVSISFRILPAILRYRDKMECKHTHTHTHTHTQIPIADGHEGFSYSLKHQTFVKD